ncbi:MAG: CHAT domain-containing protein [Acidobacteriota bacterium]
MRRLIGDHEGAVSDLRKAVAEAESQRRQLDDLITRSRFSAIVRGSLEDLLALELEESREAGSVLPLTDHLRDASFFSSVDWDTEGTIEGRRVTDFPLPDRAAILSFSVLDDRVVSWIVARGELRVHQESIKRERLEELVRRAVDRPLSETRETRTELFELLLGGYREQLDAVDHLAIAPDRLIAETPFPVLFDRDSGTHLVESHSTSFTPSALATLLSTLDPPDSDPHPMAIHEPGAVVLIGFPGSHDEPLYPYLEGVPREIAALLQIYPNALVFGSGSSKQEILEAMQHAQIIHFAGHVAPFPGVPELSSLVLAGTSGIDFITAGEIRRLQLQAEIVVFAGCKSGVAPEKGQASQPSLAHAAMRAGSRAVVASAIPLEDSVTAAISATLHRDVHQGIHIHLAVKRLHGVRLLSMNPNGDSWKSIMTHSRSVRGDSDERR